MMNEFNNYSDGKKETDRKANDAHVVENMTKNLGKRKKTIGFAQIFPHQQLQDSNKSKGIPTYPVAPKDPFEEKLKTMNKADIIAILLSYGKGSLKDLKALRLKPINDADHNCLKTKLFSLWIEHPEATIPLPA